VVFKLGELFSGPGGIAYGAITASIEDERYRVVHAWSNDYDADTCNTYSHNICPDRPETVICHDVRSLDLKRLGMISGIDAFAFGFPCNDFSIVGEHKGIEGTFGPLYQYGVDCLNLYKPTFFLAENVGGLRNSNDGKTFKMILDKMQSAGYIITPHLYKFEKYGVPQARHRIIIVGIRNDLGLKFEVPSTEPYAKVDNSSRYAIENPPIAPNAYNNELTKQSINVIERLKYIQPGENAFTANIPAELQLNVQGAKISQIYKRLDPNKPSYTITGSGGGGTHVYHWENPRALTNRERARLQTFPDEFQFLGSKESVRKQIGMAVPVRGARLIFEAILRTFAGIHYLTEPANIDHYSAVDMVPRNWEAVS
jgi:DNA (cytosine-5)-methyltransferase 1